jgi:hypothetical protein
VVLAVAGGPVRVWPALAQRAAQVVVVAVEAVRHDRPADHAGGKRLLDQVGGDLQLGPEPGIGLFLREM